MLALATVVLTRNILTHEDANKGDASVSLCDANRRGASRSRALEHITASDNSPKQE